jgi:triacylglycerol esterase/lipase EstA (alpha/beta hydrolase family)
MVVDRMHQFGRHGKSYLSISFTQSNDDCGSARDHATELGEKVQEFLRQTGMQQLNIVGFSKDGIDARVYLQGGIYDVANTKLLIQYKLLSTT